MQLRKQLFWDTDITNVDYQRHARYVIERIFMCGSIEDINSVLNYYGEEKVKEELKQCRELDKKTLNFASVIFNIPIKDFRCYTIHQSTSLPWNY